jgi:sugar phosphate isomerase/epimerase
MLSVPKHLAESVVMSNAAYRLSVFTKPWKLDIGPLGEKIAALGFDGIELPVRPGYPVEPDNVTVELPKAAALLREKYGLRIESIAGPTDEATIAACGEAGIPIIRICPSLPKEETYQAAEARHRKTWEELIPLLDKHRVTIGVQNHSGRFVPVHAMGLARLIAGFDPKHVAAVWDVAHNALEGESVEIALDLLNGPHLQMVNLKNALRRHVTGPEANDVTWQTYWTSGRQGFASWPRVIGELTRRGWSGVLCLTAEYSDANSIDRLIAEDVAYAKRLIAGAEAEAEAK